MKKTLGFILLTMLLSACTPQTTTSTPIILSSNALSMKVGDMATLEVTGNSSTVEWINSNDSVATVFYGVVTAKAVGKTIITAKSGDAKAQCEVFVTGSDGSSLRISPAVVSLKKGETYQFQYGNTYDLDLTWTSSDETIATVDNNGFVTAIKGGNATITLATNIDSVKALVAVEHEWREYQLVWSDEFNGTSLDENIWTIQTGGGGWGNNESQYYTARTENLRVENGNLIIQARKETYDNREYTSARIMSKDKKTFTYGKMEARISLPGGGGLWPAFWMMGNQGSWPNCGEIDIMEYVGNVQNRILGTLHTVQDRSGSKSSRSYWGTNIEDNYHTYGIEWTKEEQKGRDIIRFYVDGEVFSEQVEQVIDDNEYWPFNKPHFFIINMAVGGNLGGSVNDAIFDTPRLMKVDWVRVYQREEK